MRRLAPLLVLLFILPSLAGCLGGPSVTWGSDEGEYMTSVQEDNSEIRITNFLPENTAYHYATTSLLTGCDGEGYANGPNEVLASESREQFHLSGWLVRAKVFDEPTSNWTLSLSSWIIKMMPYEEAEDVEPGSLFFSVLQEDKDWPFPYRAEGYGMNTNNPPAIAPDSKEFPHDDWAIVGMIPADENIFDALIQIEGHVPISIDGYLVANLVDADIYTPSNAHGFTMDENCQIGNSGGSSAAGASLEMVVTSITYDGKVVSSSEEYIAGDIPIVGRGLYTTILLISIVAAGALYIFARNQIVLNADTQAQSMLSEQQMRAGKSARHEAARHEARMAASAKAKEAEYTGKPTKKTSAAPKFDIGAALAENSPGTTGNYVAGSSATSTDEADAMEEMITDMQEERAFEQELQEKGLRGIIGNVPGGRAGGMRRSIATQPHTSRLSREPKSKSKPDPVEEEVQSKPKKKPTRKTRKTQRSEPEPEPIEEESEPVRRVDSDVNDEGDFSDFSL